MPAETYAQIVARQAQERAQFRRNDPGEHYPYKHHIVTGMLAEGTTLGPGIPDQLDGDTDSSRTIDDYMSRGIADASRDYIDAQGAWLTDPGDDTLAAYGAARDQLIAARLDHRQERGTGFTIGAAARRGGN
jgi:hypothetical protein